MENGARRGSSKMIKNQRNELNLSLEFSEEQEKKRKEKNGKESEVHLDYGNLLSKKYSSVFEILKGI